MPRMRIPPSDIHVRTSPNPVRSVSESPAPTWFVYILRCSDGTLYTGVTLDLDRRCRQHNAGTASRYTRSRLPAKLVYREEQPGQGSALKREASVKRLTRREKLALICRRASAA